MSPKTWKGYLYATLAGLAAVALVGYGIVSGVEAWIVAGLGILAPSPIPKEEER